MIISNHFGIEHRPVIHDKKRQFDDWEADTLLAQNGTGMVVNLVERKSKFQLIRKMPAKSAAEVSRAVIGMRWRSQSQSDTIAADNATEFCEHKLVVKRLKTDVYFTNLYSSWERGLNERFNGLLQQYISKVTDLRTITNEQIA